VNGVKIRFSEKNEKLSPVDDGYNILLLNAKNVINNIMDMNVIFVS